MKDTDDDLSPAGTDVPAGDDTPTSEQDIWNDFDAEDAAAAKPDPDEDPEDAADDFNADEDGDEDDTPDADVPDDKDAPDDPDAAKAEAPDLEKLKAQNERLEQQYRSEQNRSIAQQRRADKLQKELDRLTAAQTKDKDEDDADRDDFNKKLADAKEEYGDVIGPLADAYEKLASRVDELSGSDKDKLADIESEIQELEQAEMDKLTEEHSDGLDAIRNNREVFNAWIEDQPKRFRDIFESNRKHLVDGTGAALIVTRFKQELARAESGSPEEPSTETQPSAKRQRQLAGARTTRPRGRQTSMADPDPGDDPQAIWDDFDRKEKAGKLR